MNANEWLQSFIKAIEKIVGRVKGKESPSVKSHQSSEEKLVVREMFPIRIERISV